MGKAASSMIGRQTAHQQIGIKSFIHRLPLPAIKAAAKERMIRR
jgi:hypothetical protein